jgi:hypothetical protein
VPSTRAPAARPAGRSPVAISGLVRLLPGKSLPFIGFDGVTCEDRAEEAGGAHELVGLLSRTTTSNPQHTKEDWG